MDKNHWCPLFQRVDQYGNPFGRSGRSCRIIARRYGEQSEKESDKSKDLGEELADVLFVTLCLANQTGTDLQSAFDKKMKIKTDRDKDRHQNNVKLK